MDGADAGQTSTANKRLSAIPRLSKLPLPNPRPTQLNGAASPLPTQPRDDILDRSSVPSKPVFQTSRLAKRSSIASLPRATPITSKDAPGQQKSISSKTNSSYGSLQEPRPSAGSKIGGLRSATSRSQLRPPQHTSKLVASSNGEDQLGSLDGFRSASRQGSHERAPSDPQGTPEEATAPRARKASRPSLSDRTIESLQTLPATPKDRRQSDFFSPVGSPMGPPLRPGSGLSGAGSFSSRPGTSDGSSADGFASMISPPKKTSASAKPASRISFGRSNLASANDKRRSVSTAFTTKLQEAKSAATLPSRSTSPSKQSRNESLSNVPQARATYGGQPGALRKTKSRPSLGPAFAPAGTDISGTGSADAHADAGRNISTSSAALRQQIAAAKAAARKEKAKNDSPQDFSPSNGDSFEVEMHADPFNSAPKDEKHILRNRINAARIDGKLNIAAMNLKCIPEEVINMYDTKSMEESNVNWAEVVDLTRFIAADNEFEEIDDSIFPDRSNDDLAADDHSVGNQFGGLESLDLHGNALRALPMGFRRLERLTSLNLAHNKLDNASFDLIAQMQSLKELKLGNNAFTGNLPATICKLPHLEILDLQSNRLLGLPETLRELVSLKVLNVSGNQLTTLSMDALQQIPLIELDASSNALIASLFPIGGSNGHATLQVMNIANNSIAALTFMEELHMPQLRSLNVTNNHLTVLPSVAGWTELVTLAAGDNKLLEFPQGFTSLRKLRNVNLTSNEIHLLDPGIAKMSSLESLVLAANPLREKKFLTMSAADIKRDLEARLAPSESSESEYEDVPSSPVTVIGASDQPPTPTSSWSLTTNGVLDLTMKDLSDDTNDILGSFLQRNEVREMHLQSNRITCIPPALWLGTDLRILNLSTNALGGADYLSAELELPALQELNLSKCRLTSLDPLLVHLQAPKLRSLNVCANRLSGSVPVLRAAYPQLSTFLANDNKFEVVTADALSGLANVNLAGNNIAQLPADLGLLWDEGLRHLDVSSNAFRVPSYRILEKGTEATLRWLRDKLPAERVNGLSEGFM